MLGVIQKLRGQNEGGEGQKQSIIVHVHGEKCPCGGRYEIQKGQNHVHVVIEWPLTKFKSQDLYIIKIKD